MTMPVPAKLLPSGASIPVLGLGVYKSKKGKETYDAVLSALQLGYRHIDTAQWYRNELDVGRAIKDSGLPREQVFITTKLWMSEWGYEKASAAILQCNERLGGSYIDLMLLHAPGDKDTRAETWRALEDMQAKGVVRDIGVSNFGEAHLEKLFETARVKPALNQVELHPWLARASLVAFCRQHGVLVEAYSPLAKAKMFDNAVLQQIASDLQVTPAQVLVAYSLAKDFITIPKSTRAERQRENLEALQLRLSADQVAALDGWTKTSWWRGIQSSSTKYENLRKAKMDSTVRLQCSCVRGDDSNRIIKEREEPRDPSAAMRCHTWRTFYEWPMAWPPLVADFVIAPKRPV